MEVFFDDFKVTHTKSPVIQQDDYYPFGLSFNSYQRENSTPNQYKFNGKEEQDELSLGWLDYGARMYMPELGRWGVIDPLSDKMRRWSPYDYAFDNPIRFIDPDGMMPESSNAQSHREWLDGARERFERRRSGNGGFGMIQRQTTDPGPRKGILRRMILKAKKTRSKRKMGHCLIFVFFIGLQRPIYLVIKSLMRTQSKQLR